MEAAPSTPARLSMSPVPSPLPGEARSLRADKPVRLNFFPKVLKGEPWERRRVLTDCGVEGREGRHEVSLFESGLQRSFSSMVDDVVSLVVGEERGQSVFEVNDTLSTVGDAELTDGSIVGQWRVLQVLGVVEV